MWHRIMCRLGYHHWETTTPPLDAWGVFEETCRHCHKRIVYMLRP